MKEIQLNGGIELAKIEFSKFDSVFDFIFSGVLHFLLLFIEFVFIA